MKFRHIIIFICMLIGLSWCLSWFGWLNYKHLIKPVIEFDKNVEQEINIDNVKKTLMLSYRLSKWEAHYYGIIFKDFSNAYNVPWEIYPAIVRIESNFRGTISSEKGAKGLMQVLEGTGKSVANDIAINYIDKETLWNDVLNIVIGCTYLSQNINKLGLEGGVSAYLGGSNYQKTVKVDSDAHKYIGAYKTTVWQEYQRLSYIYAGVCSESNNIDTMVSVKNLDIELFSKIND